MNKDEALEQAISALENLCEAFMLGADWRGVGVYDNTVDALKACKEALEQPAQEPVLLNVKTHDDKTYKVEVSAPSWQGLTAKEIASIPLNEYTVQTVERMLKEKNT